jgi:hypothetical protein
MSMSLPPPLPVEFGNASDLDTRGTGWMIGYSDWACLPPHDLRYMPRHAASTGLCVKWFNHAAGDPAGEDKPLSTGRTMSMLAGGNSEFRIEFSRDPAFPPAQTVSHVLRRSGDFVVWGPGVFHRAYGLQAATMLTIRWEPEPTADRA